MKKVKRIGLVAHDNRKSDLAEWVDFNWEILVEHKLICTGTTGKMVEEALLNRMGKENSGIINLVKLKSGPLGGDQQLGSLIVDGEIDILIFLWDPMQPQPHDVDVKALLRITTLYNLPTACNRSTADFLISSALFNKHYVPKLKDYTSYINRKI